jgi:flagellar motor switch/type III secretory pathway protein FliN
MSGVLALADSISTPYLLLGESMRRELTRRLRECIEYWRREWADERSPEFRLELHEARAHGAKVDWRGAVCFHVGSQMMFIVPTRMTPWVSGMHAHVPSDSSDRQRPQGPATIAAALEMEALSVLANRIFDSAGMQRAVLERGTLFTEAAAHERGAARCLRVSVWPGECVNPFVLSISPALASGLLPTRRPTLMNQERMERRSAAVTPRDVGLEAVLGTAEITVADLARLAVGDVIVLNASLSEPAELKIRAGERIAAVSAGSCGGRRAVQIRNESRRGKS